MKAPTRTVQLASGTYTCPAGRYARVSAYCRNGGTISVNTVVVLASASWNAIRRGTGNIWMRNTAAPASSGLTPSLARGEATTSLTSSDSSSGQVPLGAIHQLTTINTSVANGGGAVQMDPVFANSTAETAAQQSFMVVAGDAVLITGSGGLHVEEYTY